MSTRLPAIVLLCLGVASGTELPAGEPLQGTRPLTVTEPLDVIMVDGIDRFALREIAASAERREKLWNRDTSSAAAWEKSVAPNREHLRTIIGAVDPRVEARAIEMIATNFQTALIGRGDGYNILAVRWPVLEGVTAEGILLEPADPPVARIVAIPDADWLPEQIAGLVEGVPAESQFARRLVEQGCQVLIPTLINRDDTYSGNPDVRYTNQPHREFIYRQAFEMGRHIIGYEVQKVLAAVDQFTLLNGVQEVDVPIGVAGVGEGGLLAFYSAALDTRIDACLVSGYFGPREDLWQEPIYRNVWALLSEFGDAEIVDLIAPRAIIVEAAAAPEVAGPPSVKQGRNGGAAPGRIITPGAKESFAEFRRSSRFVEKLEGDRKPYRVFAVSGEGDQTGRGAPGSSNALSGLLKGLGVTADLKPSDDLPQDLRRESDPARRQKRQFDELVEFTQKLLRRSARVRDQVWGKADRTSLEKWAQTSRPLRDMVYDEMIGRLPHPTMDPNVRTRQVLDEPGFVGYEVMIDVYPDVIAG